MLFNDLSVRYLVFDVLDLLEMSAARLTSQKVLAYTNGVLNFFLRT